MPGTTPDELARTVAQQKETIRGFLLEKYEPIAIIGVGLRFPGGNTDLDSFADFLREGRSGIRPVPADRWDVARFGPAADGGEAEVRGKITVAGGGYLDQIDEFDALFFNISPKEADYVDPQQRMLLETGWEALENAGISATSLRGGNGGVYIGASSIDYALEMTDLPYPDLDGHLAAGITGFSLSGRLSYFLGWHGPSLSVDTACASALTALHMAVAGLRRRECDIALCGSVNALHHPRVTTIFSHASMLAPDGQCKTFDDGADGYVRAEGCGVLVLKRFSDARRDGDTILSLVRGTAVGQDGDSAGLTVPNGIAQYAVMRDALASAMLKPADIQYVEAHGTGTPLGDPIEMGAISDLFAESHSKERPLVVASVKTNLGHMEPASGLVGVIKALLQIRDRTIYPHLNLRTPSGRIPWDTYPVRVPVACEPWQAKTRRALVNSFGFAGTIAAAVIEEPPPAAALAAGTGTPAVADGPAVLTLSAKNKAGLRRQAERYQDYLGGHPDVDIRDLCYTANVGRSHFAARLGLVASSVEDLRDQLARHLGQDGAGAGARGRKGGKVAFLFAGQGAQYPGMCAALYRQFPVFRERMDECDELLRDALGRSVRAMVLGEDPAADDIHQTLYTQPALFALEYALAALWMSWGVKPAVMIGHSIGEVVAATMAGVFRLPDAIKLVTARARLMQSVTAPGGMAAVTAPAAEIAPLISQYDDLALGAINAPRQCVISGGQDSLVKAQAELTGRGYSVKPITVSHAFHSPLMREVAEMFRDELAGISFREPRLALISNVTGQAVGPGVVTSADYWVRHIVEPVNFHAGMLAAGQADTRVFVEIGPSSALSSLAKESVPDSGQLWVTSASTSDTDGTSIRRAVAQLYRAGAALSWTAYHAGREGRRIALPSYAFDRKRYWLPNARTRHLGARLSDGPVCHPLLGEQTSSPAQLDAGTREFTSRLDAASADYLPDYTVNGQTRLPAAAFLEMLLAVQDAVYGQTSLPMRGIRFGEPLTIDPQGHADVRTRLTARPDRGGQVEVVSVAGDGAERCHVSAVICPADEPAGALDAARSAISAQLTRLADEPGEARNLDELFADLAGMGLEYGPAYQRLLRATDHGGLVTGDLASRPANALEHLPPDIMEGALHLLTALGDEGPALVPRHIELFRLVKKPRSGHLRVLASISATARAERRADLIVTDAGQPAAELAGMTYGPADDLPPRRGKFHEVRWIRRSLRPDPARRDRRLLIAYGDAGDLARLAGRADPGSGRAGLDGTGLDGAGLDGVTVSVAATAEQIAAALRDQPPTDVCWYWRGGAPPASADELRAECERNYRELLGLIAALDAGGFGRNQRLWLVTEQAQWSAGDDPATARLAAASLWGFGHVLLNEYPSFRATMVDLPAGDGGHRLLLRELRGQNAQEFQIAWRNGIRRVRRLLPSRMADADDGGFALVADTRGELAGLWPRPSADREPGYGEVQVLVRAVAVTEADLRAVRESTGRTLGTSCAGTVTAAGPGTRFLAGDEVIVHHDGCARRRVTVPASFAVPRPAVIDPLDAAALAAGYVAAGHALHKARAGAGDTVLIYPATSGAAWAAVHLARRAGATVLAVAPAPHHSRLRALGARHVADSAADVASLLSGLTGGRGLDVVLSGPGDPAAATWPLAADARVVPLDDLDALAEPVRARRRRALLRLVARLAADGALPTVTGDCYALEEIEECLDVLAGDPHGGLAIRMTEDQVPGYRPAADRRPPAAVRPDRSYLITGGHGALGLVTAAKLADLGARHLVLVSRGGAPAPDVARLRQSLDTRVEIIDLAADIADPRDVRRIMAELDAGRYPLGGIVHTAGVLADGPVGSLTWQDIDSVFGPKVYGSWLLHEATATAGDLGFFVGFSSAAAILGGVTQANYAAANAFMDNLMRWRAASALPALSINWGPWSDVGMSARLGAEIIAAWQEQGIGFFTPARGMRTLATLLGTPLAQVAAGECAWNRFVPAKPVPNALYQRLCSVADGARTALDMDALLGRRGAERLAAIVGLVQSAVAEVLRFDEADTVDPDVAFTQLGLDSMVAMELRRTLEAVFRIPLPASIAFDYPSAEQLAEFLDSQLTPDPAAA